MLPCTFVKNLLNDKKNIEFTKNMSNSTAVWNILTHILSCDLKSMKHNGYLSYGDRFSVNPEQGTFNGLRGWSGYDNQVLEEYRQYLVKIYDICLKKIHICHVYYILKLIYESNNGYGTFKQYNPYIVPLKFDLDSETCLTLLDNKQINNDEKVKSSLSDVELKKSIDKIVSLSQEIQIKNKTIKSLNEGSKLIQSEYQKVYSENEQNKEIIVALQEDNNKIKEIFKENVRTINSLKQQLEQIIKQEEYLRYECNRIQQLYQAKFEECKKISYDLENKERILNMSSINIHHLKQDVAIKQKRIEDYQNKEKQLNEDKLKQDSLITYLQQKEKELLEDVNTKNNLIFEIEKREKELSEDINKLDKPLQELKSSFDLLKDDNENNKTKIIYLENLIINDETEIKKLNQIISNLNDENDNLKKKLYEKTRSELIQFCKKYNDENDKLKKSFYEKSKLENESETSDFEIIDYEE